MKIQTLLDNIYNDSTLGDVPEVKKRLEHLSNLLFELSGNQKLSAKIRMELLFIADELSYQPLFRCEDGHAEGQLYCDYCAPFPTI